MFRRGQSLLEHLVHPCEVKIPHGLDVQPQTGETAGAKYPVGSRLHWLKPGYSSFEPGNLLPDGYGDQIFENSHPLIEPLLSNSSRIISHFR
jgi:hypothetical protein